MNKMGNSSRSNHEGESLKPKQPHHDIAKTLAKVEENSKNLKLFCRWVNLFWPAQEVNQGSY